MLFKSFSNDTKGIVIAEYAMENGCNHFLTLKPGLIGRSKIDEQRDCLNPISVVFREYARYRNALPRRAVLELSHFPFFVGAIEKRDRFGNLDPHLHCYIALEEGEEPFLRGFLRDRFGRDATRDGEALDAFVYVPGCSEHSPRVFGPKRVNIEDKPTRRIILRSDAKPSFDLQALGDDVCGLGRYIMKKYDTLDVVTHGQMLKQSA